MSDLPIPLGLRLSSPDESTRAFAAEDAGFDDHVEDIDPLLERLVVDPSRFVREAIVTALTRMTHAAVGEGVLPLLSHEDPYFRNSAVALLQSRGPSVLSRLEALYPGADSDVRKLLVDTASGLPGQPAERILMLGLADPDINVRIAAVEYLGERGRHDLKGALESLLRHEQEPMLLSATLSALEAVADASTWAIIDKRYPETQGFPKVLSAQLVRLMARCAPGDHLARFFAELPGLGLAGVSDWIDGLESLHDRLGFRALPADHFQAVSALLDAYPNPVSRHRLLKWLGRIPEQQGVLELLQLYLASPEPLTRQGAALGLCRIGSPAAQQAVLEHLSAEVNDEVRTTIQDGVSSTPGVKSSWQ